jgi:hypothetical protein
MLRAFIALGPLLSWGPGEKSPPPGDFEPFHGIIVEIEITFDVLYVNLNF